MQFKRKNLLPVLAIVAVVVVALIVQGARAVRLKAITREEAIRVLSDVTGISAGELGPISVTSAAKSRFVVFNETQYTWIVLDTGSMEKSQILKQAFVARSAAKNFEVNDDDAAVRRLFMLNNAPGWWQGAKAKDVDFVLAHQVILGFDRSRGVVYLLRWST